MAITWQGMAQRNQAANLLNTRAAAARSITQGIGNAVSSTQGIEAAVDRSGARQSEEAFQVLNDQLRQNIQTPEQFNAARDGTQLNTGSAGSGYSIDALMQNPNLRREDAQKLHQNFLNREQEVYGLQKTQEGYQDITQGKQADALVRTLQGRLEALGGANKANILSLGEASGLQVDPNTGNLITDYGSIAPLPPTTGDPVKLAKWHKDNAAYQQKVDKFNKGVNQIGTKVNKKYVEDLASKEAKDKGFDAKETAALRDTMLAEYARLNTDTERTAFVDEQNTEFAQAQEVDLKLQEANIATAQKAYDKANLTYSKYNSPDGLIQAVEDSGLTDEEKQAFGETALGGLGLVNRLHDTLASGTYTDNDGRTLDTSELTYGDIGSVMKIAKDDGIAWFDSDVEVYKLLEAAKKAAAARIGSPAAQELTKLNNQYQNSVLGNAGAIKANRQLVEQQANKAFQAPLQVNQPTFNQAGINTASTFQEPTPLGQALEGRVTNTPADSGTGMQVGDRLIYTTPDGGTVTANTPVNEEERNLNIQAGIGAANLVGIDPVGFTKLLGVESNYNHTAVPINRKTGEAIGTARGLAQITDDTWKMLVNKYGSAEGVPANPSRLIATDAATLAAYYVRDNARAFKKATGRDATPADDYGMYFLGPSGYSKFTKLDPNKPVPENKAFKRAIKNNEGVFKNKDGSIRTPTEVVAHLNKRLDGYSDTAAKAVRTY